MLYANFCNGNFALTIVGGFCHAQAHRLVGQTVYTNNQNECKFIRANARCRQSHPNDGFARNVFETHCALARCRAKVRAHDVDVAATCCQAMCATNHTTGQPQTQNQMLIKQTPAPKCFVRNILRNVATFGVATPKTEVAHRFSDIVTVAMIISKRTIKRLAQSSHQPRLRK